MLQTALWPTCAICRHRVNPRSAVCVRNHPMCTADGCQVIPETWPVVAVPRDEPATLPVSATGAVFLVDLASYQQGIDLAAVKAAGFSAVNIKLTQGNWYTWAAGKFYADAARALGMTVLSFAWIDNSASGAEQAAYAYRQYQVIGAVGHQCDCEDSTRPAPWQTWVDYIRYWQARAPVCNYTGDWWWPAHMGDRGAEVCPLLWAAPNDGYLSAYPGDTSAAWHAGYGGWGDYALLQYAVRPVDGAAGGNLSMTAIRDPAVWATLTGGASDVALTDDDIRRIWEWKIGGPTKYQAAHYGLSDTRDLVMDGKSSYDGNSGFFLPRLLNRVAAAEDKQEVRDAVLAAALAGTQTAVQAIADMFAAGGGTVDAALIIAAVHEAADRAAADATALRAQLDAAEVREAELRARLAAALGDATP